MAAGETYSAESPGRTPTVRPNREALAARTRTRLLVGTALLAVVQLVHLLDVLRYNDRASFPGVLADPLGLAGIGIATAAFVATARRRRSAKALSLVAGSAIALGFVLQHGLPFDLGGVNNPYWTLDRNRADTPRWATVILLIGLGVWTAMTAWGSSTLDHAGGRTPNLRSP